MGTLICINDIFNEPMNTTSTGKYLFAKSENATETQQGRQQHLKLEEVAEARLDGGVGLPAVTHNAKEPAGGRTETSEELGNCQVHCTLYRN